MTYSFGWIKDYPDFRDYTITTQSVKDILTKNPTYGAPSNVPTVDLRQWCSPVEDQGALGSCTAQAGVGLLEYFEKRAFNNYLNASRLFLYKTTRNLLKLTGDTGAYLRDTMKAMVLFGIPPEDYLPYNIQVFDQEPSAFCYAYAQNYKSIIYYRLDSPGASLQQVLVDIKKIIAAGLPTMFGFTVYSSISNSPNIPYPSKGERILGGHAVVAVGYNDNYVIGPDRGAFIIRNSWGTGWGEKGYGYLPYKYVTTGQAADFWTLVKASYVDSELFSKSPNVKK